MDGFPGGMVALGEGVWGGMTREIGIDMHTLLFSHSVVSDSLRPRGL